jgi:hypothetical protein
MISKFLQVVLLASVKYFLTIPYALLIGMDYEMAVAAIIIGGISGFFFFYYLLKPVTGLFKSFKPFTCRIMPEVIRNRFSGFCSNWLNPRKKVFFSRRSRTIVKIKRNYGMWGIIIATPVLLSIPVGAFLARHYYRGHRKIVLYMLMSIAGWGILFSVLLRFFPGVME